MVSRLAGAGRGKSRDGGLLPGRAGRLRRACSSARSCWEPPSCSRSRAYWPGSSHPAAPTRCTACATGCTARSGVSPTSSSIWNSWVTAPSSSGYLRALGYRMRDVEQTGSNFGADLAHETPVRGRHRAGHDGGRRRHVHQRRLLEHIVLRDAAVDRAAHLPRERSCLPGRRAHRRELPDRHEGDGAAGRAGPGPTSGCSVRRASRSPGPPLPTIASTTSGPGRSSAAGCGRRTGTTSAPWGCSWPCGGCTLFIITLLAMAAWAFYRGHGALVLAGLTIVTLLFSLGVLHHGRAGAAALPVASPAVLLHLRPVLLVARALLETAWHASSACSTAPRSRARSGA